MESSRIERRSRTRLEQMMAEAEMLPEQWRDSLQELAEFVQPFAAKLDPQSAVHLQKYLRGLLSYLERKNAEAIAYLLDQDRQPLQKFLGLIEVRLGERGPVQIEAITRQVQTCLAARQGPEELQGIFRSVQNAQAV